MVRSLRILIRYHVFLVNILEANKDDLPYKMNVLMGAKIICTPGFAEIYGEYVYNANSRSHRGPISQLIMQIHVLIKNHSWLKHNPSFCHMRPLFTHIQLRFKPSFDGEPHPLPRGLDPGAFGWRVLHSGR